MRLSKSLLIVCLMTLGLPGCAASVKSLEISVPASLRAVCEGPDPSGVETVSGLAAFSVRQDGALKVCDKSRETLVQIIDASNAAGKPKRSWRNLWGASGN